MSEFEVSTDSHQASGTEISILRLKGELDANTFSILQDELERVLDGHSPRVVLDCEALEYISSAGLGVLKKMTREFRAKEGDIRLTALTQKINSVITLLGFNQVLKVYATTEEALVSYVEG